MINVSLGTSISSHVVRGRLQSRLRVVTTWTVIPGKIPTLLDSESFHGSSERAADINIINMDEAVEGCTERERDQEAGKWGRLWGWGGGDHVFV